MSVKITKETLQDGSVRWRARGVSAGTWPNGKRRQITVTGRTKREVEREVARVTGKVASGTFVPKTALTVAEMIGNYLRSNAFEKEANTIVSAACAVKPALERFGQLPARSVTRADVEGLRDWLLTQGRRRGGKPGGPLGPVSVRQTLDRLSAAYEQAIADGQLEANPVRHVKRPTLPEHDPATWTPDELGRWLKVAMTDRLSACWLLSACGLRRGEVTALTWADIDWTANTLTVRRSRVLVGGEVIVKAPKTRRSCRTLPLFEPVASALAALELRQRDERDELGTGYGDGGWVAADESGEPVNPASYSGRFARLCQDADVPRIHLHACRATMNSILEQSGVPDSVRAAWLGHSIEINRSTYLATARDLTAASDVIGRVLGAA